jgi:hypothetical protein
MGSGRRAGRGAALVAVIGLLPGLAACSTVPLTSATVQITQAPERPVPEVGIEPLRPEAGATPEEIVRRFIDAAASTLAGHPIAREHLTPQAAETWSDETGISVISQDYASVTTDEGSVKVTADLIGTVDERGIFIVGGTGVFTREFSLEEVEGEWRISNPPDGLILLQPDFERLYDRRQAYFLDPTGQRVVPDPRYLITGDAQPTALINRVLEGPSAALSAGVRNPLSGDVQLRSAVTVNGQSAVVDLTGLGTDPAPVLAEICAQVVWTLRQLGIRTVDVRVDGEPVELDGVPPVQTTDDWISFDPDTVPADAVGHYVDAGALRVVTTGEPSPGPAGAGAYGLTSAAVKADVRTGELSFLAGVRSFDGREQLLAGPYAGELAPVLEGGTLSAPTVASTRAEAWVVRDGTEIVRIQAGSVPQAVTAPTLPGLGRAEVLELSPDGVRAAVVVDGPEGATLYVGTVVRDEDGTVALRDLRGIAPSLSPVVDVAWRDSEELLVLAGDVGEDRIVPYLLGVDGWGLDDVSVSGLPSQPTSIAAAPTRLPLVSAGGTIWQQASGTWITLERGAEPRPGTDPFYPL